MHTRKVNPKPIFNLTLFFNKEEIDKELVLRRFWSLYIYSIFQIYGQNSKTCYLLPSYSIENDSFIEHDFFIVFTRNKLRYTLIYKSNEKAPLKESIS